VAAAAAIAAPDLDVTFMTFLQRMLATIQMRTKSRRFPGSSHAGKSSVQMRMTVDLPHAIHSIFRHWITHPELTTDDPRFGYSRSKRKVSFFWIDSRSMPNPDGIKIFHYAPGVAAPMPSPIK
jgi:hypothetical protein